jgi:hypothetical protein
LWGTVAVGAVYFAVDLVLCLHSRKLIVFTDGGFETFLYDTMIAMGSSILFVSAVMFLKKHKVILEVSMLIMLIREF